MANIGDLVTPSAEYLTASGLTSLTVTAGCVVTVGSTGVFKTDATVLSTGNLDAGSAFVVGKDYYVYICDPGSEDLDEVYKISLNSTYPDGYNAETSRKIGGFHYGRVRQVSSKLIPINTAGAEKGSGWESNVASGIVPRSVWTLKHRPKCSPEGMVYAGGGLWVDIYLASSNGVGGVKSAYNATPLTGTEGHNSYDFIDLGLKSGKRLLSYSEWQQAAYGSPQEQTAIIRTPGRLQRIPPELRRVK